MSGDDEYPAGYGGAETGSSQPESGAWGPGTYPPDYERTFFGSAARGIKVTYGPLKFMIGESAPAPDPRNIHNIDAEAALLGAMMIVNDLIPDISERVSADDFYDPMHARLFRAIVKLHEKGRNPSPVLLRPIFDNDPDMKQVGGAAYLAGLTGSGAGVIGARDFADQIAELAVRRKVGAAALDAVDWLCDTTEGGGVGEIEDAVAKIQDTADAAMIRASPLRPRSAEAMVLNVRKRTLEISETDETIGFPCISVPDLDAVMGRLEPGYHVIAGRPGMCKTTLAMTASWGWAAAGAPGEYYAGEMTEYQIDMRHTSDLSHAMRHAVRHDRIRAGTLGDRELEDLLKVAEMAKVLPLTFVSTGKCDIRRIETLATRAKMRWKNRGRQLRFVVIDYMQKFLATDERGRKITDETEKVNAISAACERMAQRLEIAVVALSQVARAVEDRKDRRPQLNDLRQSGNIEQDADTVSFVYRDEVYHAKDKPKKPDESVEMQRWRTDMEIVRGQLELIGAKNRHGKPRTRTLRFAHPFYAVRGSDWNEMDQVPILGPDLFSRDDAADEAEWLR